MNARPLDTLVDESETWGTDEWWRLDIRSLDDAPAVQRDVAVLGPREAWSKEYGRASAGGCLKTLTYVFSIAGPTIGAGWMLLWALRGEGGDIPLELAGWMFGLAALITIVSEVVYRRRPRAMMKSAIVRLSLAHIIPGALVFALTILAGAQGNYDPGVGPSPLWLVPVGIDVAVYIWMWMRGATVKGGPKNPIENVERGAAELDADLRDRILATRNAAVDRLHAQGKIDDEIAARARLSALGFMALTVAPEGRSGYYPEAHEGIEPR